MSSANFEMAKGDDPQLDAILEAPLDPSDERQVMCPYLYRATHCGLTDLVIRFLGGLTEKISHTNNDSNCDVKVVVEHSHDSKNWRSRILEGDHLCTLGKVTAEKNTVLHIAAEQGHVDLAKKLIEWDNNLLASENSRHETPLHLAARAGNHRIISLIVSEAPKDGIGANEFLMKTSTAGDTALHEAARNGHAEAVTVLMKEAPEVSAVVNKASMSPLYLAVVRNSTDVVDELLKYKQPSAVGPNKQNALHAAVLRSCQEITTMLLDWNAELAHGRDDSGSTPLHYAASDGDITVVKEILDKAPLTVCIRDYQGSSPLHVAAQMPHYAVINLMIDQFPDSSELRDNQGQNFLHVAAQHVGKLKSQKAGFISETFNLWRNKNRRINLDRHGLKKLVNERDNVGNTPLHYASKHGFSDTISELIESKADCNDREFY